MLSASYISQLRRQLKSIWRDGWCGPAVENRWFVAGQGSARNKKIDFQLSAHPPSMPEDIRRVASANTFLTVKGGYDERWKRVKDVSAFFTKPSRNLSRKSTAADRATLMKNKLAETNVSKVNAVLHHSDCRPFCFRDPNSDLKMFRDPPHKFGILKKVGPFARTEWIAPVKLRLSLL